MHWGPLWEKSNKLFWEDFTLKTSSLTPGKPTIKKATLTGKKNRKMCLVEFELPSNVEVEDSIKTFVSFFAIYIVKTAKN